MLPKHTHLLDDSIATNNGDALMNTHLNNDFHLRRSIFYYQGILKHCLEQCEPSYVAESIRAAQKILQYADQSYFELLTELLGQHRRMLISVAAQRIDDVQAIFDGLIKSAELLESISENGFIKEEHVLESVFQLRALFEDNHLSDSGSDSRLRQPIHTNT